MDQALIFDIYRGTTHDGPGVRDTVFFQGCPLSCAWCHNPEGMASKARVWWDKRTCIGCMLCHEACPTGANRSEPDGIIIDTDRCVRCGSCVNACPTGAMSFTSRHWTLEALLDEVMRDKPYYDRTGGGVTVSGGECMNQHKFLKPLFVALHSRGVTTALDTCGFAPWHAFTELLADTDYVLYDLKLFDAGEHRRFTGQDNGLILENARRIAKAIADGSISAELWIRTPLIPGASATEKNLSALSRFIAGELSGAVSRWELCAFNNSCITKYERLGQNWNYNGTPLLTAVQAEELRQAAISGGIPQDRVFVTGLLSE